AVSRLQIVGRRKPRGLNASLLCIFPIIVNEERLSTTIEQLQRWIGQNLRGSGSRKFPISYPVFASSFALGRDQAPVSRQSWTEGAADKNIVIEVPNRYLPSSGRIQHIIGLTVRVEIAHCYKIPTVRKTRSEGDANKDCSRQIPDCRLVGGRVEKQVIGPAVSIEVCHTDHFPVSWKSWTKGAADKNVVI